jgi:hypothetical protein
MKETAAWCFLCKKGRDGKMVISLDKAAAFLFSGSFIL